MTNDAVASAAQDGWVELARSVRGQLLKASALLPAMTPAEAKTFVEACREALWLELNAETFDKEVTLNQQRLVYGDGA